MNLWQRESILRTGRGYGQTEIGERAKSMAVIRKCGKALKRTVHKIVFRIKLWQMDNWWHYVGGSCWELFPLSFYYTHTAEEVERITAETREKIQKMIDELE